MPMHYAQSRNDEIPRHRKLKRSHERRRFTIEYFAPRDGVWRKWTREYVTERFRDEAVTMLNQTCTIGWVFRTGEDQ